MPLKAIETSKLDFSALDSLDDAVELASNGTPKAENKALATLGDQYVGPRSKPTPSPDESLEFAPGERDKPLLLYNGACNVCRRIAGWVKRGEASLKGGPNLIARPIGYDEAALKKLHPGLTLLEAYTTVHVLMPDGTLKSGGDAVGEVLKRVPGTRWLKPLLNLSVLGLRPFQGALDAGYWVLNKIRPALGCESCGDAATPAWAKPIEWAANAYRWARGIPKPGTQLPPATAARQISADHA